jgi:hypothetical protein
MEELRLVLAHHTVARFLVAKHIHHLAAMGHGSAVAAPQMKTVGYCQTQAVQDYGRPSGVEVEANHLR